uniref:polynucleotide adenylyltransferase n=1 Tax=Globodera rostochiensis TaxID=31243 RepID=A0A914HX80_GLORO
MQKEHSTNNSKQKTIQITHQCPEKGKSGEKPTNSLKDDEGAELVANFKRYILEMGDVSNEITWKFQMKSLKWNLHRKLSGMLEFAIEIGRYKSDEIIKNSEKYEFLICLLYKYGVTILEFMKQYAEDELINEKWKKYLEESRVLDIIQLEFVDCDDIEVSAQILKRLFNPSKIFVVNGQNMMELLEISEHFRYFMCHEVTNFGEAKKILNRIVHVKYMTLLENAFPDVLRVDIRLNTTAYVRIQQLMMNRSDSEQYKNAFLQFATAVMVKLMRLVPLHFQSNESANVSLKKISGLNALVAKANDARRDALLHFGSTLQICVMIKIAKFVSAFNEQNADTLTEKAVKKLRTDECEDGRVQAQLLEEAIESQLGAEFTQTILDIAPQIDSDSFKSLFKYPGAKTRLLRLVGTKKRLEEVEGMHGLAQVFAVNALINDEFLWVHYLIVMFQNDKIESNSHKLGADLAVFAQNNDELDALLGWIGQLHRTEFTRLLKNGKLDAFKKVLGVNGSAKIRQTLCKIFAVNAVGLISEEGHLNNISEIDNDLINALTTNTFQLDDNAEKEGADSKTKNETPKISAPFLKAIKEAAHKANVQLIFTNIAELNQSILLDKMDDEQQHLAVKVEEEEYLPQTPERKESLPKSRADQVEAEQNWWPDNFDQQQQHKNCLMDKADQKASFVDNFDQQQQHKDCLMDKADQKASFVDNFDQQQQHKDCLMDKADQKASFVDNFDQQQQHKDCLMDKADQKASVADKFDRKEEFLHDKKKYMAQNVDKKEYLSAIVDRSNHLLGEIEHLEFMVNSFDQQNVDSDQKDRLPEEVAIKVREESMPTQILNHDEDEHLNGYRHIQCPPKNISLEELRERDTKTATGKITQELVQTYLEFLSSSAGVKPLEKFKDGQQVLRVELHALLWFLARSVQQMLIVCFKWKGPIGSKIDVELFALNLIYGEGIMNGGFNTKLEGVFLLFKFRKYVIRNKILWQNSEKWRHFVSSEHPAIWDESDLIDKWVKPEFDETEAIQIYFQLTSNGQIKLINYVGIVMMIDTCLEAQRFFCNLSNNEQREAAKNDLAYLIGPEIVVKLEETFPEILQIDHPVPTTLTELYKKFFAQKTETLESVIVGARLFVPLLLNTAENRIRKMAEKIGIGQPIQKALEKKLKQLLRQIYPKFWHQMPRLNALCILHEFNNLLTAFIVEEAVGEEEIGRWNADKECADMDAQMTAFLKEYLMLLEIHCQNLDNLIKNNSGQIKEFIAENRVISQEELRNNQIFANSTLRGDYLKALLSSDKSDKMVGKLSCFISVLVRWLDSEMSPENANRTFGLKQIGDLVWPKTKRLFEDLYDELEDCTFDKLAKESNLLGAMSKGLRAFVEAKKLDGRALPIKKGKQYRRKDGQRTGKRDMTDQLLTEYQHMLEEAELRAAQMQFNDAEEEEEEGEEGPEFEQWLRQTHWDTLLELLRDDVFRGNLNKAFLNGKAVEERLEEFVGTEKAKKMPSFLNLQGKQYESQLQLVKEKEKIMEKEEQRKRRERESELADQNMQKIIAEEKRKNELKKEIIERKRERIMMIKQKDNQKKKEKESDKKKGEEFPRGEGGRDGTGGSRKSAPPLAETFGISSKSAKKWRQKGIVDEQLQPNLIIKQQNEEQQGKSIEKEAELFGKEWQNELKNTRLISFVSDEFLNQKFYAFLQNPSEATSRLMDIGVIVNELWHRMEVIGQLNKFEGIPQMEKAEIVVRTDKMVELEQKWAEMETELTGEMMGIRGLRLFDYKQKKSNLADRFDEHLASWRSLLGQLEIDSKLCEQNVHYNFTLERPHLGVKFPEISQQIQNYESSQQKDLFFNFINEIPQSDANTANNALDTLNAVVKKWSNGAARLILTGSHLVGTRTFDSDIDTICAVPQKLSLKEERGKFYGIYTCVLNIKLEQRICSDGSLYCELCKHPNVERLYKFPSVYIQVIRLKLSGVDFDISFVAVPDMEFMLLNEPVDAVDVQLMMKMVATNERVPSTEVMLKSLAGYLANKQMMELIGEKNMEKFRSLVVALKHWSKRSHIYGNIFGFFNGTILSVLASKVLLWYPNGTVRFLFQKFMLLFVAWNWPMPVKLIEKTDEAIDLFSWNPSNEPKGVMPIITPSNLSQNCANNVNRSTFKIIQNEMRNAYLSLTKGPSTVHLRQLFPPINFTEKFEHFLIIFCTVSTNQQIEQFCGFVERKIRQQLAHLDTLLEKFINYSHLKPTDGTNWTTNSECPEKVRSRNKNLELPFCKFWIVGLKIKENIGIDNEIFLMELRKELGENLKKEFDAKIYKEYEVKVLKEWHCQNIKLHSQYAEAAELAQFFETSTGLNGIK